MNISKKLLFAAHAVLIKLLFLFVFQAKWSPGIQDPYQVCIVSGSSVDLLKCEIPAAEEGRAGTPLDLSPLKS